MSDREDDETESGSEDSDGSEENDSDNTVDDDDDDIDSECDDDADWEYDEVGESDAEWRQSVYREETKFLDEDLEEQIEATKKDLMKEFGSNIAILKSEKNWFTKKGLLKEAIGDAVEGLDDAYHGLSANFDTIPKEVVDDFRTDLGQKISDNKIVSKLCSVIVKLYPRKYRRNREELIPEFEKAFGVLWGYTDASEAVARDAASNDEFLAKIAEILRDVCEPSLNGNLKPADELVLENAISCLHNMGMVERNFHTLREHDFVEILQPYLESTDSETQLTALATLADIVDEKESEILQTNTTSVEVLMDKFERATDLNTEHTADWSSKEIARTIRRLARNDAYKHLLVKAGALPLLVKMAQKGNLREQAEATGAIWVLAFDEDNQKKIIANPEAMNLLSSLRHSEFKKIAQNCEGTLWTMRQLIKTKDKYKHLVEVNKESAVVGSSKPLVVGHKDTSDDDSASDDDDDDDDDDGVAKDSSLQKVKAGISGHIMISYQWANQKILIKIRDELRKKGYDVWMDIDQMGGSTLAAMADAVEKASVVLVCMSQKYKDSPNCRAEAEYCFQLRKPIIPLKMDDGYRADGWLGMLIGTKLFFDFSGKYPFDEKIDGLLKELSTTVSHLDQQVSKGAKHESEGQRKKERDSEPVITLKQLNNMKRAYDVFDDNEDGRLSVSELGDVLRSLNLNPTQAEIEELMEKADTDGNGYLDYNEYISFLKPYLKDQAEIEQELKDAFKTFKKGSGGLNIKQLRLALTSIGETLTQEETEDLFDMMDENEDGIVDIDEFVRHLCGRNELYTSTSRKKQRQKKKR